MPKNITWIVNNITQVGGIERVVCNISNYFQDNNYRVKIVSLNTTDGKAYFKLSSKVKIQHLGYVGHEVEFLEICSEGHLGDVVFNFVQNCLPFVRHLLDLLSMSLIIRLFHSFSQTELIFSNMF